MSRQIRLKGVRSDLRKRIRGRLVSPDQAILRIQFRRLAVCRGGLRELALSHMMKGLVAMMRPGESFDGTFPHACRAAGPPETVISTLPSPPSYYQPTPSQSPL